MKCSVDTYSPTPSHLLGHVVDSAMNLDEDNDDDKINKFFKNYKVFL